MARHDGSARPIYESFGQGAKRRGYLTLQCLVFLLGSLTCLSTAFSADNQPNPLKEHRRQVARGAARQPIIATGIVVKTDADVVFTSIQTDYLSKLGFHPGDRVEVLIGNHKLLARLYSSPQFASLKNSQERDVDVVCLFKDWGPTATMEVRGFGGGLGSWLDLPAGTEVKVLLWE